jgi:ankyrin repeat protein
MSARSLRSVIHANGPDLAAQVQAHIERGTQLDGPNEYGESPLRVASNNGRFDIVAMLLDAGANWYELEWTYTIQETVFGTLDSMRASILAHQDLEKTDFWRRTPLLVAILTGDVDKAELLLELGADPAALGRCGKTAPAYAIQRGDLTMLQWLVDQGFNMEACDDFGHTPLMEAAAAGQAACVRFLAKLGADLYKTDNSDQRAIQLATSIDVTLALVEYGDDLNDMSEEAHAALLAIEADGEPSCSRAAFSEHATRTFGRANPERTNHPFWLDMVRCGASAWRASERIGSHAHAKPVWSYKRFGRTTTILPDGTIIEIGGEHEDWYDPDFCIYNDVTVFDGRGNIAIYSYPPEVFPPTDAHTATLIVNQIYIIGRLGYQEARQPGFTPVYRLELSTYKITAVKNSGQCPGWIYNHKARAVGTSAIVISGGSIQGAGRASENEENRHQYSLCLETGRWTRLDGG